MVTKIELFESTDIKATETLIKKEEFLAVNFILILVQCLN
jgi:hypothetical protein